MKRVPIWFSATFLIVGFIGMYLGSTAASGETGAPNWVLVCMGATFAIGGGLSGTAHLNSPLVMGGLIAMFLLMMTLSFGWVAFGPGEREFIVEVGAGVGDARGHGQTSGNPTVGRILFGIATVFMGLLTLLFGGLTLLGVYQRLRGVTPDPPLHDAA